MIDLKIKNLFFDAARVRQAVDRARRRVLSKAGAFVRQRARTSLRKRKGPSPPGQPPHSQTGLLRRFILFGYDQTSDSVVVGPAKLNKKDEVPRVLEGGGVTTVTSGRRQGRRTERRVRIAPRPYMRPAMEKELPNFPDLWRDSIRE